MDNPDLYFQDVWELIVYINDFFLYFNFLYCQVYFILWELSVTAGKSVSIPCLYESRYMNHVKYLCEGQDWNFCSYAVKTNKPDRSGKYSISDDKMEKIFTVTINQLTNKNTDYWCVVEINGGSDHGESFQLLVTSGKYLSLYTLQRIFFFIIQKLKMTKHQLFFSACGSGAAGCRPLF
uniref:Immunoglobulin V-set domain-containing protein n=1 Tax=Amphilophus citrinellus TaxID=61819 RepID=A0A3Q0SA46_AMPCI